jgi:hypothetical protein
MSAGWPGAYPITSYRRFWQKRPVKQTEISSISRNRRRHMPFLRLWFRSQCANGENMRSSLLCTGKADRNLIPRLRRSCMKDPRGRKVNVPRKARACSRRTIHQRVTLQRLSSAMIRYWTYCFCPLSLKDGCRITPAGLRHSRMQGLVQRSKRVFH